MKPEDSKNLRCQEKKLQAVERLSSFIVHKVNNPLTYILNYLFILKETEKDEKALSLLRKMEKGINEVKETLQELIDIANPYQGPLREIELGAAFEDAASKLQPGALRLERQFQGRTLIKASGNFVSVLHAILSNAVEAGATAVTLRSIERGRDVLLFIADDGPGIGPEDLESVFEPFFTTKPGASGMGLYGSYHIIKASGGDMWLRSAPGGGAEIGLMLKKG